MTRCPHCGCDIERHRELEQRFAEDEAARQERGLASARTAAERAKYWRSDRLITIERWVTAREIRGMTVEEFAVSLNVPVEHVIAIEAGQEQPSEQLQRVAAKFAGFHPAWFHRPPPPAFPMPPDCEWYVCDVCERNEPGGKIAPEDEQAFRADHRCATCGDDICEEHTYRHNGATFCERCRP